VEGQQDEHPYWRQHYGIDRPWMPTERGRRGCMALLVGGAAIIALALLVGLIVALI
jgi:hypothetical protein